MAVNSLVHISSCPALVSSSLVNIPGTSSSSLSYLRSKSAKKWRPIRAESADSGPSQQPAYSESKNPLSVVLNVPRNIWRQTMKPLSDFGFGRRSIWEGGVGLFLVSGTVLLALSVAWLRGFQLRSGFRKYLAVFEFPQALGMSNGTNVRIRGVNVGSVIRVNPSLKSIEAVVEVEDDKIIIPRNSLIEVNQSGLLMETLIEITPRDPIPTPTVGPLDPDCVKEGLIVCDRQKVKGYVGVSMDALVAIILRLSREVEEIGVTNIYKLAERVSAVIEEAKPLLIQIQAMAENVQPLLAEVHSSGILKEVDSLTRSLTQASEDLRIVHSSIMAPENTELIRKSIHSLIFTLKNIESISSDVMGFTGDEATRRNLKTLIKSLSRLL